MKILPAFAAFSAATMYRAQSASAADLLSAKDDTGSYRGTSAFLDEAAASLPPVWSGFYFGAHIGGASGLSDVTDVFEYTSDPTAKNDFKLSGTLAGLQAGYMIETGGVVFGIEAALGHMNANGTLTDDDLRGPGDTIPRIGATYGFSGDLYGELTGRIGVASDDVLLYLKGGRAFLETRFNADYEGENWTTTGGCYNGGCPGVPPNRSVFSFEDSDTLFGWTIGAGLEFALSDQMTARIEYQHYDFGAMSYNYDGEYKILVNGASQLRGTLDADITLDVVKLGVNYKVQGDRRVLH
jgi:outer membrane immunogenic protein